MPNYTGKQGICVVYCSLKWEYDLILSPQKKYYTYFFPSFVAAHLVEKKKAKQKKKNRLIKYILHMGKNYPLLLKFDIRH